MRLLTAVTPIPRSLRQGTVRRSRRPRARRVLPLRFRRETIPLTTQTLEGYGLSRHHITALKSLLRRQPIQIIDRIEPAYVFDRTVIPTRAEMRGVVPHHRTPFPLRYLRRLKKK